MPNNEFTFTGITKLPNLTMDENTDGVHIPKEGNFPSIDVIWKSGANIFGVEIYTSAKTSHQDKAKSFDDMVIRAGWSLNRNFQDNLFFIYLCSDENTQMKLKKKFIKKGYTFQSNLKVGFITVAQVECLMDLRLL